MSYEVLLQAVCVLIIIVTLLYGRSEYWKAKYETLDKERSNDGGGWREEVYYLRRIVNSQAAESALEDRNI